MRRRTFVLAATAGFLSGFALLSKSLLVVLFPAVLAVLLLGSLPGRRLRIAAASCAGFAVPAGIWLAFEIVRFGRPFASYEGERFNHGVADGLWRLLVGNGMIETLPRIRGERPAEPDDFEREPDPRGDGEAGA